MQNPIVSIIVPVYKVELYLEECVQSIRQQTYENLEIILVDDGSPDVCPILCDEYARQDSRIKVIHKQNGGLSSARNVGIETAKGQFVSFVDSDDYIDKTMIEKLLHVFEQEDNVGIVSCMVCSFDASNYYLYRPELDIVCNRITDFPEFRTSIVKESVSHIVCNKLYKASLLKEASRFRVGIYNEDALFHYYLADTMENKHYKMIEIPDRLYFYRRNSESITNGRTRVFCLKDMISNVLEIQNSSDSYEIVQVCKRKYKSYLFSFVVELLFHKDLKKIYFREYHKKLKREISFSYAIDNWGYRHQLALLIAKYLPCAFYSKPVYGFCFKCGREATF